MVLYNCFSRVSPECDVKDLEEASLFQKAAFGFSRVSPECDGKKDGFGANLRAAEEELVSVGFPLNVM